MILDVENVSKTWWKRVIYYVCLIMLQLLEGGLRREHPALVGNFVFWTWLRNKNNIPKLIQKFILEGRGGGAAWWAHVSKWHKIILPSKIWCFHVWELFFQYDLSKHKGKVGDQWKSLHICTCIILMVHSLWWGSPHAYSKVYMWPTSEKELNTRASQSFPLWGGDHSPSAHNFYSSYNTQWTF